jgi:Meiotically Up-regulated Gene 113 (MUG113) protein
MPRPYAGPQLWLDERRGTWTITDGRKRVRTGYSERERDLAVVAVHQYSNGTYTPERPKGPIPVHKVPPRRGLYVIGFGQYVKIGITTNLDSRLAQLQIPEELSEYALFVNGWRREELELHRRFAAYRVRGEWFKKEGELAEWIERGCP